MDIHCSLKNSEQFNGTKVVLTKYDLSVRSNHLGLKFWVVAYGRFDCFSTKAGSLKPLTAE